MAHIPLTIEALRSVVVRLNEHIAAAQPIAKNEAGWNLVRSMTYAIWGELRNTGEIGEVEFENLWACIKFGLVFVHPDGSVTPKQKH